MRFYSREAVVGYIEANADRMIHSGLFHVTNGHATQIV